MAHVLWPAKKFWIRASLTVTLLIPLSSLATSNLEVGVGAVDITPYQFESYEPKARNPIRYEPNDPFYDTGVDGLFDFEESGAFGADGKPGRAGIDDDGDGAVDNCTRKSCGEYLVKGSDDRQDPNGDNFEAAKNPNGTERDGRFQGIHLGGFGPYIPVAGNRMAVGVHDPIWSRALAVRGKNGVPVVLVSTDLPGLTWKHINPVRRRVERTLKIPRENIVITSTHVHSAPDASGYFVTLLAGHNKAYTDQLREWMYQSIAQAVLNMKPASMKSITTEHFSCFEPKTKRLKFLRDCNLSPLFHGKPVSSDENMKKNREGSPSTDYDDPIVQNDRRDPVTMNPRIVAAQFISLSSGETIATMLNWHNHPDTLGSANLRVSSDFPHYVREYLERTLGGRAIYFSGTVGCQIGALRDLPTPLWDENFNRVYQEGVVDSEGRSVPQFYGKQDYIKIRSIGYEIAWNAVQALQNANVQFGVDTFIKTEPVDIQVNNLAHTLLTGSVWNFDVEYADRMRTDPIRCRNFRGCVRTDISAAQIGDVGIATLPGEIDPAYILGRKEITANYGKHGHFHFEAMAGLDSAIPGKHHVVLGQANNYLSYLVHEKDFMKITKMKHPNFYEDMVTVSKYFGDDASNKLAELLGSTIRYSKREIFPKQWIRSELTQTEVLPDEPSTFAHSYFKAPSEEDDFGADGKPFPSTWHAHPLKRSFTWFLGWFDKSRR